MELGVMRQGKFHRKTAGHSEMMAIKQIKC